METDKRRLPTFSICGAPKTGTRSLYTYLGKHPDVCISKVKETDFFQHKYDKGLKYLKRQFEHASGERTRGEASPGNMIHPKAPQRIAKHIPEARLIFILRNPIERAYSQYWFWVMRGTQGGKIKSFSELIRDQNDSWGQRIIELGMYHEQLLRYEEHFEAEKMKVILYERFCNEQKQVLREVYEFIGVDPSFEPDTSTRHNVTRYPKSRTLHRLAYALWEPVEKRLGDAVLEKTRWLRSAVRNRLFQSGTDQEKPPMKPADRAYLRDIYREPNARLAEYLDRDLSHWT